MGLILDTSAIVAAERRKHSVAEILEQIGERFGETQVGLSVVTIVEITHAIQRAKLEIHRQRHQTFVSELKAAVAVYPVTTEIAERAGSISGQQAERGIVVPFEDLLIGATALHLGFEVLTANVRHFEMIPDLVVRRL